MRKNIVLVLLAGLFVVGTAEAKHYGAAGCGLGSVVWKNDNSVVSQVLAATTNGTFYSQIFGITTGTSNCTNEGTVSKNKEIPMFIEANQIALASDIARGSGETLENLNAVLGCSDTAVVNAQLQKNYQSIFSTDNIKNEAVTGSIINVLKSNSQVVEGCKNLI